MTQMSVVLVARGANETVVADASAAVGRLIDKDRGRSRCAALLPLRVPHPISAESFVIFSFGPVGDAILHDVVASEGVTG